MVAVLLGSLLCLVIIRIGIELVQPKGAFFDKLLGRQPKDGRRAARNGFYENPGEIQTAIEQQAIARADVWHPQEWATTTIVFSIPITLTASSTTTVTWTIFNGITDVVLEQVEADREGERRRSRDRQLRLRMIRIQNAREWRPAELKAMQLMEDTLGVAKRREYQQYGSLEWVSPEGDSIWHVGKEFLWVTGEDRNNLEDWLGDTPVTALGVTWYTQHGIWDIPPADKVLSLYLQLAWGRGPQHFKDLCCRWNTYAINQVKPLKPPRIGRRSALWREAHHLDPLA